MRVLFASIAVLLPCFWQARIQAGDLGSHMYNVWLAQLIEKGQAPGLYLERIYTNVLFDLWAGWLVERTGFVWGERLAAATVVLTFFWGSWLWVRRMTHASPWPVAPLLAMFAYGWAFHMGFLNFYWSMGFCFWGLAMAEGRGKWERRLWWVALIPAGAAHMLPVGWAGALWLYGQAMRRVSGRRRGWLLLGGLTGVAGGSFFIRMRYPSIWSAEQALAMLGIDQLLLANSWYLAAAGGFLGVWALGVLFLLHEQSPGRLGQRRQIHYLALTATGVLLVPWIVQLPWFSGPLAFITQRMSLAVGVSMCGLLPISARASRLLYFAVPIAAIYFFLLYRDTAELNAIEDKLHAAVRTAPAGARVVAPDGREQVRVFSHVHFVDRACIGHCYSYANYEAATGQFRVRARGANGIVAHEVGASMDLQAGRYTVQGPEAPLYYFRWVPAERRFALRVLWEGDRF